MVERRKDGALTDAEKKIVKGLLAQNWRNQDIQALLNVGRITTINSARITEVKQDKDQHLATNEEIAFFRSKQDSYDQKTGLNLYEHERLIRARESMILAVSIFNNAGLKFKTEVFTVLVNIAWTYLLHEFYERKGVKIIVEGRSLLLGQMIERQDSPLSKGMKENLKALKSIRDDVEHKIMGRCDVLWQSLFQACCLNFEKFMCQNFGEKLSLCNDLSFALHFSKMNIEQLARLNNHEIPDNIHSLDARLSSSLTDDQKNDLEYQFRVIFTLDSASKKHAHFEFIRPDNPDNENVRNVLVQWRSSDHIYPYKASAVIKELNSRLGTKFNMRVHTQSWIYFNARPKKNAKQPENCNRDFCTYHPAHRDYTFSEKWISHLTECFKNTDLLKKIQKTLID